MRSIYFMRLPVTKRLGKQAMKVFTAPTIFKPALMIGLLGLSTASMYAQAAMSPANATINNPTASLQLISLNADEIATEDDTNNLSDVADMLESEIGRAHV